jgi:hypothetical protein
VTVVRLCTGLSDCSFLSHVQDVDGESLRKLSQTLSEANVKHKLWIEQPEDIPTCIATRPYVKQDVQAYFRKLKLFKGTS